MTERFAYVAFLTVVFGVLAAITIAAVAILVVLVKRNRQHAQEKRGAPHVPSPPRKP